nr:MAG TPA: hypothetical protein [Caudoviricetes sp.]
MQENINSHILKKRSTNFCGSFFVYLTFINKYSNL